MNKPIIEIRNLSKRYRLGRIGATTLREDMTRVWGRLHGRRSTTEQGEFWALRDVSFSVQPGEVLGVVGRNGAGKSTLLKILSRITEPTSGRAILRGRVASLLEVGTGFHPDLTGRENIFLNGAILGMKRAEITARFDQITAFAEIGQFIDTPVKHYSSGMRVRLAFAVAAHLDSEILIVDEVLAVGDQAFQLKCLDKMGDVTRSGRTVLYVSHQLATMRALCSRAVLLRSGTVADIGPTAAVLGSYLDTLQGTTRWHLEGTRNPFSAQQVRLTEITVDMRDDGWASLKITSEGDHATSIALELTLFDRLAEPCGFGAISYFDGAPLAVKSGPNQWEVELDLRHLAAGPYDLQVDLTRPNQAYLDRAPVRLRLNRESAPLPGELRAFEAGQNAGAWRFPVHLKSRAS